MLGLLHRFWNTLGRWLRPPRAPVGDPAPDTEDRGGPVDSRARFWAELRAGQREAAAARLPADTLIVPDFSGGHALAKASLATPGVDRPLKILHVATLNKPITPHLGYGPIETVIDGIHKGLTALGHHSIVACSADSIVPGHTHTTVTRSLGDYCRAGTPDAQATIARHLSKALGASDDGRHRRRTHARMAGARGRRQLQPTATNRDDAPRARFRQRVRASRPDDADASRRPLRRDQRLPAAAVRRSRADREGRSPRRRACALSVQG